MTKLTLLGPRNRKHWLRLLLVVGCAYLLFSYLVLPIRVSGKSMEPTIIDGSFAWGVRLPFVLGRSLDYGDVVLAEFQGREVVLLKRVVGLPGDTIAFENGQLFRNNEPVTETYISENCDWQLPPRTVKPGYVYIIGDNRSVPMQGHTFGQLPANKAKGVILW